MTDDTDSNEKPTDGTDSKAETTDRTDDTPKMSETTDATTPENRSANAAAPDSGASDEQNTVTRLRSVLNYAVLAGLLLLAVLSAVQLYWALSRTISTFVVYEYRALVQAAFNLVVLLVAALGISVQLRRLGRGDAAE